MSVDNRTLLNDASVNTGWAGDDTATATTAAGDFYEGGSALSTQLSNALEHMYTTSIGGTRDLSAASVWFLVKDNLQSSKAAGGGQVVLHDGTDRVGFYCNGNDAPGMSLPSYYNCQKLDVTNIGALSSNVYAGVLGNLTVTAITGVGYGTIHQSKAVGAIDNVWMDASYFILNSSYALTINAGTVGTPETWADVAGDDVTNGWGMVSNLQGSKYDINASWQWGDVANADSYFTDSDFQVYIDARDMGTGNFIVRTIAGTGTNQLRLTSGLFQNLGTPAVWDLSDTDMNVTLFDAITWTDAGTILFSTQSVGNRAATNCIFNNCGQISFTSMDADSCIFNGSTDANGAVLWSTTAADVSNQDNFTYNSDGTGHAIYINLNTASLTTYNIDGYNFDGYAYQDGTAGNRVFLIDNALDGDVTINITNSTAINQSSGTAGGFSYEIAAGYTGTVTIVSAVSLTLTGIQTDSEVRIINLDDTINFSKELTGSEQILGSVTKATLANGGSGYTNGAQVLTVVGGTGTAATINVTVAGNVVVSVDSIAGAGSYSVNPTNPVATTGGGGTGATLRLTIGGTFTYNYDASSLPNVAIIVFHLDFKEVRIEQNLSATTQSIPIQQTTDRVYNNP